MPVAITRAISPRFAECELSFLEREPIDLALAETQHARYEAALTSLGYTIVRADPAPEHPDAVFIEDNAVVLDRIAVLTRPGAPSRRGEIAGVARALAPYRPLETIEPPATLDGGDVLLLRDTLYVGLSARTNAAALAQLSDLGCKVVGVEFRGCLHLKSAVTALDERTLLLNPDWVEPFAGFDCIETPEPHAANVLRAGEAIVMSASYPRTRATLEARGFRVVAVPMSEMEKAEGGVTCCSLLVGPGGIA
jgi:dimethylargininase